MRDESDFEAYLAARWPRVVRSLVLLGGSPAEAERVAGSAFALLRPDWRRATADVDPDVHAWRTVLAAWRGRTWSGAPGAPASARLAALEPVLDQMAPDVRAALVLRAVAGLDPHQVALVLGRPVAQQQAREENELLAAAEEVDVPSRPVPEALTSARRAVRGRPSSSAALAALAALVVLAGIGSWLAAGPDRTPDAAPAPRVTRVENAAGLAWWAGGTLHLPHVDVALPGVTRLAGVNGGAVLADRAGTVSFVSGDGVVTALGHQAPGGPLLGSDETGWAGWVDPTGTVPRLVVYDVTARSVLARHALPPDAGPVRLVAFDRGLLFYADRGGNWQWEPGHDDPLRVLQPGLLDVADATEARRLDARRIELVQPFFNVVRVVPGEGAQLSPDATYALTRQPGSGRGGLFGRVRIYDVRSGERVWSGLARREVALAATLGPDDEVHYVLTPPDEARAHDELRTCHLVTHRCATVERFPQTAVPPLLGP